MTKGENTIQKGETRRGIDLYALIKKVRQKDYKGLELSLQKTKIVYCKDDNRRGEYPEQKFDFLGFTFRPRRVKSRQGSLFVAFTPAISNKAAKSIRDTMRQWQIHRHTDTSLDDLAKMSNPVLKGWINYYGSFNKSALYL